MGKGVFQERRSTEFSRGATQKGGEKGVAKGRGQKLLAADKSGRESN